MLAGAQLRSFVRQQIIAANTAAGANVFENRALPVNVEALPIVVLSTPQDRREPLARGSTLYTTTVTLHASIRAAANPSSSFEAATAAGELLIEQVLAATVGNQAVLSFDTGVIGLQQFAAIETYLKIDSDGGAMLAVADVVFSAELIERIDPTHPQPLTDIRATVTDQATPPDSLAVFDVPIPQS